jgi:para-nitrobenzyl esterase
MKPILLLCLLFGAMADAAPPTAVTDKGIVQGLSQPGRAAFLGIPYAAPPVGNLRWRSPREAAPWNGVRKVQSKGFACPQPSAVPNPTLPMSEDCLTLNVWVPDHRPGERLPVMVWIHGGGWVTGTASGYNPIPQIPSQLDLYDGGELARLGKVIVVNLNYRLGALGFLSHPLLREEAGEGNFGFQDQTLALRWVQKNIGKFGGDASNVTIFGESAGAWSVCGHLVAPQSRGLFHKAILQSMYCVSRSLPAAENIGAPVVETLGCTDAACLRSPKTTVAQILAAQAPVAGEKPPSSLSLISGMAFVPTYGTKVFAEPLWDSMKRGAHARVPIIVGNTAQEPSLKVAELASITSFSDLAAIITQLPLTTEAREELTELFSPPHYSEVGAAAAELFTDIGMTCPTQLTARVYRQSGAPARNYLFKRTVPGILGILRSLGSFHGSELFYLFQRIGEVPFRFPLATDVRAAEILGKAWTSFATNAITTSVNGRPWPTYSPDAERTLVFGVASLAQPRYHGRVCDLIAPMLTDAAFTEK